MVETKAFVVYPTYRIIDNKSYIYLYGKLDNGESFLSKNEYKPYFYIKNKDLKKIPESEKFEKELDGKKNFEGEELIKIILNIPKDLAPMRDRLEGKQITTYEADIRFPYRFMIDKDIRGSAIISGKYTKGKYVDREYENPEFKPVDWAPKLKILALDIETNPKSEVLSISLVTDKYEKVLIHSDKKWDKAISYDSEREMLEGFRKKVQALDPDIITGWNVIDFDFQVLKKRFDKYKIPFTLGRSDSPGFLKIQRDFFRDSKAEFPGRMVLDGIHLLKSSFINLDYYTLDHVSQHFLGEKKIIGQKNKVEEIMDAYNNNTQKLVDYNLKDSVMVIQILKKTGVIELTIQRSLLTGMQLDRVTASVASLDSLYIRETHKMNMVCNNSRFNEKERGITGGYVRDSKPGLYENIVVLDFKSLYPSIMRTFNIDPYSFIKIDLETAKKNPEKYIVSPNGAVFKNNEGILPTIIERLWAQREKARLAKNELSRYAIKILMNSFFGVLANPSCRFFSMDVANAITHFAQKSIKLTADKIKEKGYEVIYGDTDSVFIKTEAKSDEDAIKIGKELQDYINEFYEEYVTTEYARKSFMELELDKIFKHFLMPKIRGSEKGAKKRYAGIIEKDGKDELVFTGLEAVRSDWTKLAKKFQIDLLQKIFKKEEFEKYIRDFVDDLKSGKLNDLLVYKRKINKPLEEYVKTTPPHVKAARKLKKLTSKLVEYVMTSDGPEPIQDIKHPYDYEHYMEKQLKPIADSILSFLNTEFDDVLNKSKQMTLRGF